MEFLLGGRFVRLLKNFQYIDPQGNVWQAPKGLISDGATIPRFAWSIIGGPFEGPYRRAAILHDAAYYENFYGGYQRDEADRMLYEAMREDGCGLIRAQIIYRTVRLFGALQWERDQERADTRRRMGE